MDFAKAKSSLVIPQKTKNREQMWLCSLFAGESLHVQMLLWTDS